MALRVATARHVKVKTMKQIGIALALFIRVIQTNSTNSSTATRSLPAAVMTHIRDAPTLRPDGLPRPLLPASLRPARESQSESPCLPPAGSGSPDEIPFRTTRASARAH